MRIHIFQGRKNCKQKLDISSKAFVGFLMKFSTLSQFNLILLIEEIVEAIHYSRNTV